MGYLPGRQSYWDAKVREMCKKDGGVTIYEHVPVSRADLKLLGKVDDQIAIPIEDLANPEAPVYALEKITYLRKEGKPQVWRTEYEIVRRSDKVIVARAVLYTRAGGDFPSPSAGSSFICPDPKAITTETQQLFVVEEDPK